MFLCPTAIRQLTRRQSALTTRFSSSCNNNNNKQTKDDNKEKKPYAIKKNISFMPVINIPENELAHNAFFSLHRPLLGLSEFDIKERPFFSSIDNPITDEQSKEITNSNLDLYLSSLQPFDTPLPPGHEESVDLNTYHVQEEDMYVNTHYEDEQMIDSTERLNSQQPSMPVFHMPESEDIVDYLSYIDEEEITTIPLQCEQWLLDHSYRIHLPATSHAHYPRRTHRRVIEDGLQVTTTTPLNVTLDILFISTLEGCWTRAVDMKRIASDTVCYPRRHSHPTQLSTQLMKNNRNNAISTELVRRFSSGSSTSTVASSIVSGLHHPLKEENDTVKSNDAQTTRTDTSSDHDPGHACDTPEMPSWVDPSRVKEQTADYEQIISYMREHHIPLDSSMPLTPSSQFYFSDTNSPSSDYVNAVKPLFDCTTVLNFATRWRHLKMKMKPSQLMSNQNFFCFIEGVEPMWEDKVNEKGGRLMVDIQHHSLDEMTEYCICAFVGGNLFDLGVVGIVISKRQRGDRIELWLDESVHQENLSQFK
ncbi:hypothetical protein BDB01DRAFT_762280 [Pilobolus umbonatus]|nr:hypothetical protein BDB01DRAFT_762280 [Pilobolus umbonatus]